MGKALLPGVVSLRHPGLVPGSQKLNFSPAGVGEYPAAGHSTVVLAERTFRPRRSKCFHKGVSKSWLEKDPKCDQVSAAAPGEA